MARGRLPASRQVHYPDLCWFVLFSNLQFFGLVTKYSNMINFLYIPSMRKHEIRYRLYQGAGKLAKFWVLCLQLFWKCRFRFVLIANVDELGNKPDISINKFHFYLFFVIHGKNALVLWMYSWYSRLVSFRVFSSRETPDTLTSKKVITKEPIICQ